MRIEEEIKGSFRNDYHKGLINLIYTVKQLSYEFERSLKNHGVTEQQYNILRILRPLSENGAVSIGYIKERMLEKHSDVSRIVDKLLAKGLLERKENPHDRRQKAVSINENGIELLNEMYTCEIKGDQLLNALTAEEVFELNRILDKIRDGIRSGERDSKEN